MPFSNAHHGGDAEREGARLDLAARIDAELRARIEDAVDYACLDAMVKAREARGAPAPVADDPGDRAEYGERVGVFLERLRVVLVALLDADARTRLASVVGSRATDVSAALGAQVALAKELPDYWQRFDEARRAPQVEERPESPGALPSAGRGVGAISRPPTRSGREGRGLLRRFLGR